VDKARSGLFDVGEGMRGTKDSHALPRKTTSGSPVSLSLYFLERRGPDSPQQVALVSLTRLCAQLRVTAILVVAWVGKALSGPIRHHEGMRGTKDSHALPC
jgi:hypothetical protein